MGKITDPALLQQLNGPQPQRQGTLVRDPFKQASETRADRGVQLDEARLGISQAAENRQAATLPYDVQKAQADAVKATVEANRAEAEAAKAPRPEAARIQQDIKTSSLLDSLNTARAQIGQGWATGNLAGTAGFRGVPLVGQNATNLDATLGGIKGSILTDTLAQMKAQSASGASGMGSLTEKEGERLAASVGALQQAQDSGSLLANLAKVERHYRNMLALSYGEDPRAPAVAEKYGVLLPKGDDKAVAPGARPVDPFKGNGGNDKTPGGGQVTSEGKFAADPTLKGVNDRVSKMIRSGMTAGDIRGYLNQIRPGLGSQITGIEDAINYAHQYPDRGTSVDVEKVWQPASGVAKTMGDIGMSPWGAGVIGAADTLTAGTLDNMQSNPGLARATMSGVQAQNPWAYTAGQIGGGVASGLGIEGGLAKAGVGGLARMRGGDALYGAALGAGSADNPEDSRLGGAVLGAGAGLLGGMAGRQTARAVGTAATGIRSASQRALDAAGVRMTPGQILGGGIKRAEDKISSWPVVGGALRARRTEGFEDFNRAAFDQALAPIGGDTGGVTREPGIEIAQALRGDAYDSALNPVRVTADNPFVSDMQGVIQQGAALPEPMLGNIQYTLPTRVGESFDASGNLTGRDFQQAIRGLRRDANSVANQPYGWDFGQVTRGAEGVLEGLLDRQAPGAVAAYRAANEANRNVETLRAAVDKARNGTASGVTGVFTPSQLSTAASTSARRDGNSQGTTNQPFYDLTRAGQEVLPSSVPDSGTAGRLLLPTLVAGLAGGGSAATSEGDLGDRAASGATTAVLAGLLAASPYSGAARNTIQRALLSERPDAVVRIGDALISRADLAGLLSAPAAVEGLGQ